MADKKEVSILLLGIVAILAIVGLVLLFTSPAATGRAPFTLPPYPPGVQNPAYMESLPTAEPAQFGQTGNPIIISSLEGTNLPRCPGGRLQTRIQANVNYEQKPGYDCGWFRCPALAESGQPAGKPTLACAKRV